MKAEERRRLGWPVPRWTRTFFASAFIISGAAANSSKSYSMVRDNEPTCSDFADRRFTGLSWTFDDCIDIWSAFRDNISRALNIRPPHVDAWKATADELRQAGKPCMLTSFLNSYSNAHGVGVGSTTWKHLATWILAEEAGCDWVTPSWTSFNAPTKNETATYCHWMKGKAKAKDGSSVLEKACVSVNWLAYFNFGIPSTALPEGIVLKNVTETKINEVELLGSLKSEIASTGLANVPWDRVLIMVPSILASTHLATAGSWDERKREIGRNVLQEARKNFHHHPRPWYSEDLDCGFDSTRLNVAIHVRLGDLLLPFEVMAKYLSAVEELMNTVTEVVVSQGQEPPLFHVFSETLKPCPSLETNSFDEFPTWAIEPRQVQECFEIKLPEDCSHSTKMNACSPNGSGMFRVHERPILLHVGRDVRSSLSCMIQSEGVVMGCSSFGQIAGILTRGISFFNVQCSGRQTAPHYKSIPALAVAERGHRWVPIAGTWGEPILNNTDILRRVIENQMDDGIIS